MIGKIAVLAILAAALLAGGALYYTQVYAYYETLPPQGEIAITTRAGGIAALPIADFQGIDAESSPLRFRACFTLAAPLEGDYAAAENPVPLNGPAWFECYDAARIGAALEAGEARAYLSRRDIRPGISRILAIMPDGQGFAWHQLNEAPE